jgi:hypothetical protein
MAPTAAVVTFQPRKPVMQPGTKVKTVFWKRLLVNELAHQHAQAPPLAADAPKEEGPVKFVWDDVEEVPVVGAEIEKMFAAAAAPVAKPAAAAPSASAGGSAKPVEEPKVRLLDDKRFMHISIMLKKLPPLETVMKAIRTLDANQTIDQVNTMISALPTADEISSVVGTGLSESELEKPEQWVLACARLPQLHTRLDCWAFKLQFDELLSDMERPLHAIIEGIKCLRTSVGFRRMLGAILSAGNYLNGGSARGQADGFDISFLSVIDNTKDNEGKTLAHFCVQLMRNKYGEQAPQEMVTQMAPVTDAAKFSLKNVMADVKKFVGDVKSKKKAATVASMGSKAGVDQFGDIMLAFATKSENLAVQLQEQADHAQREYIELLKYLGKSREFAARLSSDEFFAEIQKFLTTMKVCVAVKKK